MIFDTYSVAGLSLQSRYVMAPMTRAFAPGGVPTQVNVDYYRRRAAGGAGLIITEGVYVDHPAAGTLRNVPVMYGEAALEGWRQVVDAVHAEGACIFPQLWHVGLARSKAVVEKSGQMSMSPSGYEEDGVVLSNPMTEKDIEEVIEAFATSAVNAKRVGFDGIELHAAHGYLLDSFLWAQTNRRTDKYGGGIADRTRFICEILREIKQRLGSDFPVSVRLSQWKQQDYSAVLARSASEWEQMLDPLVDAGADIFHISTRRFRDPAFTDGEETLSALTRKITGKTVIAVGSAGLTKAKEPGWEKDDSWSINPDRNIEDIEQRMRRGDFDLIALGRVLLANPDWGRKVQEGNLDALSPYTIAARNELY